MCVCVCLCARVCVLVCCCAAHNDVLMMSGDRLKDGWEHLLAMLEHAARVSDALIVREAFPNVQLIASEYVVVMPHAHMLHALRVGSLFGLQQEDLNISLTTITCVQ